MTFVKVFFNLNLNHLYLNLELSQLIIGLKLFKLLLFFIDKTQTLNHLKGWNVKLLKPTKSWLCKKLYGHGHYALPPNKWGKHSFFYSQVSNHSYTSHYALRNAHKAHFVHFSVIICSCSATYEKQFFLQRLALR